MGLRDGHAALQFLDGNMEEAREALRQAETFISSLPHAGVYQFDRSCLDVIRQRLDSTDVQRIGRAPNQSPAGRSQPVLRAHRTEDTL